MKTILVPLSGAASDRSSLELASRVARVFSSHINVVHVQRNIVEQVATMTMGAGAISQEVWDTLAAESRSRETNARKQLDELCSKEGFALLMEPSFGAPTASWRTGTPRTSGSGGAARASTTAPTASTSRRTPRSAGRTRRTTWPSRGAPRRTCAS